MNKSAIVLLSGGMDSATTLAIAAQKHENQCYALSFAYGQKNNSELIAAKKIAQYLNIKEHKTVNIDFLQNIGGSSLTDKKQEIEDHKNFHENKKVPNTYVPMRNTLFITCAAAWAEVIDAQYIYIGASYVDYSGYPDCRPEYFAAFNNLLQNAILNKNVEILTPLLKLSKRETIAIGLKLNIDYNLTISCYRADDLGRACGKCSSCILRKQGFIELGVPDQTIYQSIQNI